MPEDMVQPVAQPSFTWEGPDSGPTSKLAGVGAAFAVADGAELWQEALVGSNNLRPVAFLARGLELSRSVVLIVLPGVGSGTGFLIADDLLITNNHVLNSAASANDAIIRFNYEDDLLGNPLPVEELRCVPNDGFHTSPYSDEGVRPEALDYTVVRLAAPVGERWGHIRFADAPVAAPADVVVIQHPGGEKKQIAIADNEIAYVDDMKVQYLTDTLPGSSGSPVFNDRWELVALHHAGGFFTQPGDPAGHLRNEGVRIPAILADLPEWALSAIQGQ